MMKSENQYLKDIAKNTGAEIDKATHTDNYYLRRIEQNTRNGGSGGGSSGGEEFKKTLTDLATIIRSHEI